MTYIKFVCTIHTEKKDLYRTRATMGGNLINYPDNVGTPTANLLFVDQDFHFSHLFLVVFDEGIVASMQEVASKWKVWKRSKIVRAVFLSMSVMLTHD
jgi:hypothetical protein